MTFSRTVDQRLADWLAHPRRKPLILRGARQTGKTTAVRRLAEHAPHFVELNLERPEHLALVRSCRSARDLLARLSAEAGKARLPDGTLVFLDEIQEHPDAIGWLRFLYEDHPELAVVAAGSLLEVRLRGEAQPFPVGRVQFLRLEPLTFLEFLRATSDEELADRLERAYSDGTSLPASLHELALARLRTFLLVGGLPESVEVWRTTRSLVEVGNVHRALRQAYAEDLLKYRARGDVRHLQIALTGAPAHYGARFKVRHLAPGERDKAMAEALDLLEQAMVIHRAAPTSSHTIPLVPRKQAAHKLLPLDIGLALSELAVRPEQLEGELIERVLDGRVAEAFVGLQLLAAHPDQPRSLFFWTREGSASANAELDYLVPTPSGLLPVEVKAGAAGRLKSLHLYLAVAETSEGVRLSTAPGKSETLDAALSDGTRVPYRLHSVPLYLAECVAGGPPGTTES